MGEQQGFVKGGALGSHPRGRCGAGYGRETGVGKGEGHQPRPRVGDGDAHLRGDLVGAPRRPHLGDGFPARGNDKVARGDRRGAVGRVQGHAISGITRGDIGQRAVQPQVNTGFLHQAAQHGDDLFGGSVAEELAEGLFVPRDPMCVYQFDEIPLSITRQRRFGEMGVGADEGIRRAVHIGEIAAPAARNADFLARCFGVIHDQYRSARVGRAHHACGPCT